MRDRWPNGSRLCYTLTQKQCPTECCAFQRSLACGVRLQRRAPILERPRKFGNDRLNQTSGDPALLPKRSHLDRGWLAVRQDPNERATFQFFLDQDGLSACRRADRRVDRRCYADRVPQIPLDEIATDRERGDIHQIPRLLQIGMSGKKSRTGDEHSRQRRDLLEYQPGVLNHPHSDDEVVAFFDEGYVQWLRQ